MWSEWRFVGGGGIASVGARGRKLGIRLRGKSGLRGWKTAESKSQTAQTRCAQTAVRSDS
ncbi:MAG: hypothetical protein ACLSAC_12825 [Enterocloster bolteae]